MLYIQCRDAIMEDIYPTTKEEARDLAAIQAQITFGDFSQFRECKYDSFQCTNVITNTRKAWRSSFPNIGATEQKASRNRSLKGTEN